MLLLGAGASPAPPSELPDAPAASSVLKQRSQLWVRPGAAWRSALAGPIQNLCNFCLAFLLLLPLFLHP